MRQCKICEEADRNFSSGLLPFAFGSCGSKVDAILQHSTILSGSVKAASVGSEAAGSFARGTLAPYKSAQAHPVMRQPEAVFFSVTVSMAFSDIGLPFSIQLRRADCTT